MESVKGRVSEPLRPSSMLALVSLCTRASFLFPWHPFQLLPPPGAHPSGSLLSCSCLKEMAPLCPRAPHAQPVPPEHVSRCIDTAVCAPGVLLLDAELFESRVCVLLIAAFPPVHTQEASSNIY